MNKIQFSLKSGKTMGTFRENLYIRIILRVRNVSYKICGENQNSHFMFKQFIFPKIVPFMR